MEWQTEEDRLSNDQIRKRKKKKGKRQTNRERFKITMQIKKYRWTKLIEKIRMQKQIERKSDKNFKRRNGKVIERQEKGL